MFFHLVCINNHLLLELPAKYFTPAPTANNPNAAHPTGPIPNNVPLAAAPPPAAAPPAAAPAAAPPAVAPPAAAPPPSNVLAALTVATPEPNCSSSCSAAGCPTAPP